MINLKYTDIWTTLDINCRSLEKKKLFFQVYKNTIVGISNQLGTTLNFGFVFLFQTIDYFSLNYKYKVIVLKFTKSKYELKRYMNNDLTDQPTFFWSNLNPFGAESWNWNWGVSFFKFLIWFLHVSTTKGFHSFLNVIVSRLRLWPAAQACHFWQK